MSGIPKQLVQQVKDGQCVLFLGAGVHTPPPEETGVSYDPNELPLITDGLAKQLAHDCEFTTRYPADRYPNEYPLNLQRVALFADTPEGGGRSQLVDYLHRYVEQDKKPSQAVRALAKMPFRIIVTTNYDGLFEAALRDAGKEPSKLIYNPASNQVTEDLRNDPTEKRPLVFKIHGDFSRRESIVVSDEDYITFVQRMADKERYHPVPLTVRYAIQRWPTLFLGYSLRDYNLRLLFRTLRWGTDESNFPLSFSVDHGPDPLIRQVWENERNILRFVVEDLWKFVPQLQTAIVTEPPSALGHA